MSDLDRCRCCHQLIRWAKTVNNKGIPLDPDPSLDGDLVLSGGVARRLTFTEERPDELYICHFATSPRCRQMGKKAHAAALKRTLDKAREGL
jgi:hypothetical protein